MKKKAIVLGCGLVGATIVRDLAATPNYEVTAADVNANNLRPFEGLERVSVRQVDLSDRAQVRSVVADQDIAVGALPSRFGFETLKTVIEAEKPYCDISFMPEDASELDGLAKKHGVTAVVDCGVSPGLSNLIVGWMHHQLDSTEKAIIYVGGLPKVRRWPFEYKAPFAPADVLEEYTRPARIVQSGKVIVKEALSEPELIDFPHVGTLVAFNTDGLRSLLHTTDIPDMKEKTLRYPGHIELMRVLRETGFLDKEELEVRGVKVRPLDVTSKLLFPKWALEADEEEFTFMRVVVEGQTKGQRLRHTFDLYDEFDRPSRTSSMARTTGFPCTIIARMIASGELSGPGVFPPERLAPREGLFEHMLSELKSRNVSITHHTEPIQ